MDDDPTLLKRYAERGEEAAFRALVDRHLGLVYGAARRRTGDTGLAEEVCQDVFALLAQRASELSRHPFLPGWLMRTAGLRSASAARKARNRSRKMSAHHHDVQAACHGDEPPRWEEAAAHLDAAIEQLPENDRRVVVLRFLQQQPFHAVGRALGKSEAAAQKQASRALEKLRKTLRVRGVAIPSATLAAGLAAESAQAAPAALTLSVCQAARESAGTAALVSPSAGGSAAAGSPTLIESLCSMTQTQIKTVAATALIAAAIPCALLWKTRTDLRAERDRANALRVEMAAQENATAGRTAAAAPTDLPGRDPQPSAPLAGGGRFLSPGRVVDEMHLTGRGARWDARTTAKLGLLAANLSEDDIPAALAKLEAFPASANRNVVMAAVLERWAQFQPEAAMEYVEALPDLRQRYDVLTGVLDGWAQRDPQAALAWYRAVDASGAWGDFRGRLNAALRPIFTGLGTRDLAAGAKLAVNLESGNLEAIEGLTQSFSDAAGWGVLLDAVAGVGSDAKRNELNHAVLRNWTRTDPRAAADWATAQEGDAFTSAFRAIADSWFEGDPANAANWVAENHPDGAARGLADAVKRWTSHDPFQAAAWLREQPDDHPGADLAKANLARSIVRTDPEGAFAWAQAIGDDTVRRQATDQVVSRWRGRDADAAGTFLAGSGLSEERIGELNALQPTGEGVFAINFTDAMGGGGGSGLAHYSVLTLETPQNMEIFGDTAFTFGSTGAVMGAAAGGATGGSIQIQAKTAELQLGKSGGAAAGVSDDGDLVLEPAGGGGAGVGAGVGAAAGVDLDADR